MSSSAAVADVRDAKAVHPVFIDVSIGTHMVLNVSDSDTASDFKKNIVFEHRRLYPAIGDIKVNGLRVKEGETVYDMADSVCVMSLFGAKRCVMSVDVSRVEQNNGIQHLGKDKAGDQLALPWEAHSRSLERHGDHGSPSTRSKVTALVNQKAASASQLASGDFCKDFSKNVEEDMAGNDKQLDSELVEKLDIVKTRTNSKKRALDVDNESLPKDDSGSGLSVKKKLKTQVKSNAQNSEENVGLTYDNGNVNDKGASMNNENFIEHKSKGKSEKEKDGELVQKPAMENEKSYSLIDVGSNGEERTGDQIDTHKDDLETALEHRLEVKLPERKKGTTVRENIDKGKRRKVRKSVREKDESLFKHADNIVGDTSSTVSASVNDERKMNEVSENTLVDVNKGDDVIVKEMDIPVENMEGKPGKEFTDINDAAAVTNEENLLTNLGGTMNNDAGNLEKQNENTDNTKKQKRKKKIKRSASRNEDESVTKHVNGDVSSTVLASVLDERRMNEVPENTLLDANEGGSVIMKEVEVTEENVEEILRKESTDANDAATVTNEENLLPHSEILVNNDADKLEKRNEKADDAKKQKKRKIKKSAGRNEDEMIPKHVNGDVCDDVVVKEVENSVEKVEVKSVEEFKDSIDVETVIEKQNEKMDDAKKPRRKMKARKAAARNEDESITAPDADRKDGDKMKEKDAEIGQERLAGKANSQDLPSKHQSTEVEQHKSQSVDHHHLPEEALKDATVSEVSKVNHEADVPEDRSHELDFMDYFSPGHQSNKTATADNGKDMKKTKVDSKNENNKVLNTTNIDNIKAPKRAKKIDAQNQKANKQQQPILAQTRTKTVKKQSVNSTQQVKSLLNAPGTIFEDDSDTDETVISGSSTQSPSSSSSSTSSSSGSHAWRGKKGGGKYIINPLGKLKNMSMTERLRSSSSFRKARLTASSQVEDTESQPVDFVPDSQPLAR